MEINSDAEMLVGIQNIAIDVIIDVSRDMLSVLRQYINDYTYDPLPNTIYYNNTRKPTYQFRNAFEFKDIERVVNEVVTELFYDWQNYMDFDADTYLHGDPYNGDMRERLADILNTEGAVGFSNKIRHPYWDIYIEDMFDNGGLSKLFDIYMRKEFSKHNIVVRNA